MEKISYIKNYPEEHKTWASYNREEESKKPYSKKWLKSPQLPEYNNTCSNMMRDARPMNHNILRS